MDAICMNDRERPDIRVRTRVAGVVAKLDALTGLLEAAFLEKCSRPFL